MISQYNSDKVKPLMNKEYKKGFEKGLTIGVIIVVVFVFVLLKLFPLP